MAWNLKEFFKNESEFNEFIELTKKQSIEFNAKFKGKLANLNTDEFLQSLKTYEKINEQISKIMSYSHLDFALDTTKGANLAKNEQICNEISENLLFFELEFNELESAKQDEFIAKSHEFEYYLTQLKKQKSHQLSFLEERILLKTSPVSANAFSRLFDETMANLKFEFRGEFLSEEQILSLLHDSDRNVRKDAALSLSATLEKNLHLLGFIYNMIKTDLKISCELRNYELGEDIMHQNNQISKSSVDALIKATENNFDIVGKFYEKKREILGFNTLYDYDRYAPLKADSGEFSYEEAKEIVLKAFYEFSPKFGDIAKTAFENGWIDEFPKDHKQSGAFSHSASKDTHPFVLLNFTNKRRDVFTLAHELGHAIHQYLAYGVGFFNSFTPLTTAETASVFCEMLVFDYMRKNGNGDLKAMLAAKIEDIFATLYRQINFTTFERRIHATKDELGVEEINQIWLEESAKMFDGKLVLNDYYKIWWSYIPHFIHSPFYCYSYGYAQLLVLALYGLYKSGKCENFVQIYSEFLSLGGSMEPKKMVAKFGLDIEKAEFWQIGIDEIRNLVDEFLKD